MPLSRNLAHQPGQFGRPQVHLDAMDPHIHPLDQQLDNPRLLRREQLVPKRVELGERPCASHQGPTLISDCRKMPHSWSMTVASISAAETRPIRHASGPRFSTSPLTE
jgi:hypothetical protein